MSPEMRIIPKITKRRALGLLGSLGFATLAGINAGQALTADDRVTSINNTINKLVSDRMIALQNAKPAELRKPSRRMSDQESADSEAWDNRIGEEVATLRESETSSRGPDLAIHETSRMIYSVNAALFLSGVAVSFYYAVSDRNEKLFMSVNEAVLPLRKVLGKIIPGLNPLKEHEVLEAVETIIRSSDKNT